jgi:uncharacterized protein (TIGR03435 family)
MAWTKTTVTASIVVLLLVAAVVVKLAFFPSVKDAIFTMNIRSLQQAPANVVIVRLTHFPKSTRNGVMSAPSNRNGKSVRCMMGRNVPLSDLIAMAYGQNPSRVVLPPDAPKGNYDFLVTVADNPEEQLQSAIRRKLGYTAQMETRDADVLALKVENPNSPGLTISAAGEKQGEAMKGGKLYLTHMPLSILPGGLERRLKTPVVDKTGLTNFYDFSIVWNQQMQSGQWDQATAKKMLDAWGLGLEPDTAPLHMLVVKKGIVAISATAKVAEDTCPLMTRTRPQASMISRLGIPLRAVKITRTGALSFLALGRRRPEPSRSLFHSAINYRTRSLTGTTCESSCVSTTKPPTFLTRRNFGSAPTVTTRRWPATKKWPPAASARRRRHSWRMSLSAQISMTVTTGLREPDDLMTFPSRPCRVSRFSKLLSGRRCF